jgi:hypothetical protein
MAADWDAVADLLEANPEKDLEHLPGLLAVTRLALAELLGGICKGLGGPSV